MVRTEIDNWRRDDCDARVAIWWCQEENNQEAGIKEEARSRKKEARSRKKEASNEEEIDKEINKVKISRHCFAE